MKRWTLSAFAFFSFGLYSLPAFSASFDCRKASTWVERTVCSDAQLSKLDDELAQHYQDEMEDAKDNSVDYTTQKRQDQNLWLIFQRNTCPDKTCLIQEYKERLGQKPKYNYGREWSVGDDIGYLPTNQAFGSFEKTMRISVYNPDAANNYNRYDETNVVNIFSVTDKPYLAVIDSQMVFHNAHMCTITDQLATWSGNHWTLINYESDKPAELRLYPATYKGKPHILIKDIDDQYRKFNCGMRGYFEGLLFKKAVL